MSDTTVPRPTAFSTLANIFRNPRQAMLDSEDRPGWLLLPLLIVIAAAITHVWTYFGQVDYEWMISQINNRDGHISDEERAVISSGLIPLGLSVAFTLGLLLMFLAWAVWFWVVEKFTTGSQAHEFMDWYSLSVWSGLPLAIGSVLSIFYVLIFGAEQVHIEDTWFYSVNSLILHLPQNDPGTGLANSATPFLVWMIWLCAQGHSARTRRPFRRSLIIVSMPIALIFVLGTAAALAN